MTPAPDAPTWRSFENLPHGPLAASIASSCSFSLATLEVASLSDAAGYALVERQQPEIWRWAIIGPVGFLVEEGFERTQAEAKRAAEEAMRLSRAPGDAVAT